MWLWALWDVLGLGLGTVGVFSNLNDSVILRFLEKMEQCRAQPTQLGSVDKPFIGSK